MNESGKFNNVAGVFNGTPYIPPFFNSPDRIAALVQEVKSWEGTPWCANSAAKGKRGGVSCHRLPTSIYMGLGALGPDFPIVFGKPALCLSDAKRIAQEDPGRMEKFLDSRPEFIQIARDEPLIEGDLIGLRIAYELDHLGVIWDKKYRRFAHVLAHKHVDIYDHLGDPTFSSRYIRAWRIR